MKQIPTPKELLELIKSSLFKEIDIECVLTMSSAKRPFLDCRQGGDIDNNSSPLAGRRI